MNDLNSASGQLRAALLVAWKDCLIRFHHRITLVFVVILPLALTLLSGLAFHGQEPRTVVALVDQGQSGGQDRFKEITDTLAPIRFEFRDTREEAQKALRNGELQGVIVFPDNKKNSAETVEVLVAPAQTRSRQLIENAAIVLANRAGGGRWATKVVEDSEAPAPLSGGGFPGEAISGSAVMFILMNCLISGALALPMERRNNTLARLLISPLTRGTLILGQTLGVFFIGVAQAAVVFGFGLIVGVRLGSIPGFLLVTIVFIFVGSALGLTISAWARREETIQAIASPAGLLLSAVGGAMFPVPEWMKPITLLFPTGWAMDAYDKLMMEGQSWFAVLPHVGVLAGFAAVFFLIGIYYLRWE